jgi:hypothetical protein
LADLIKCRLSFGEGSGEGVGGSGAEPGPEKVPAKVWDALVQSQVRFNRVPEKVPEKVWKVGAFGAA